MLRHFISLYVLLCFYIREKARGHTHIHTHKQETRVRQVLLRQKDKKNEAKGEVSIGSRVDLILLLIKRYT